MPNQQLIEYIKQARAAGKSDAEIKSALLGAGWQDGVVSESFTDMAPFYTQSTAVSRSPKMIVAVVFVVVALLIAGGGFAYWYLMIEPEKEKAYSIVSEQKRQNSQSQEQSTYYDPINLFWREFSSGNYKVSIGGSGNLGSSFYFKEGELVRVGDPKSEPGKSYFIIREGKVYSLHNFEKTFKEFDLNTNQGKTISDGLRYMSLLDPLIKDAKTNHFTWSKDGDGYIARQKWYVDDESGSVVPVDAKIIQDSSTGLIHALLIKMESGKDWEETIFHYENVGNIEEIIVIPSDFKKEN